MQKIVERNNDGKNMKLDTANDKSIFDLIQVLGDAEKDVMGIERYFNIYEHTCKDGHLEYYILFQSTRAGDTDYIDYPRLDKIKRILTGHTDKLHPEAIKVYETKGLILKDEDLQ